MESEKTPDTAENLQSQAPTPATEQQLQPENPSTGTDQTDSADATDRAQPGSAADGVVSAPAETQGSESRDEGTGTAPEAVALPEPESRNTPAPGNWWDAIPFEGKEFTELRPDGMLLLKATPFAPERQLQMLHPESAEATVKALTDKFKEVETKVRELASEWNHTEDKKKLSGRVERVRDYLLHAAAIGDFTPLHQQVGLWDNLLQEGADKAYADRLVLVDRAEALAAGDLKKEGLNELRELGEAWKGTGYVDKDRADALWVRFEAARDSFYNRRREHQDAERAELQSNLDLKNEIVDKAERYAASDDWKESTNAFNALMDQWKATGRTFHDKNEALWQRFITAKNVFYDRKKEHFKEIQSEQEGNFEMKLALITRAETLSDSTDWNKTSDAYNALMDEWKAIGRVPADKTEELWSRLSAAKDKFFNAKRSHYATMRVTYDDNHAQKQALLKRAETLQHSHDWRGATDEFAELMEEWKKIGPVARREQNEALWQSFNKARKTFFDRKDDDRDRRRSHMEQARVGRLSQVQEFLSQLRAELKEFEEDLADHHLAMANLGSGKMDNQIRANLERLIAQGSPKVEKKRAKIAEIEAQLAELMRDNQRKPQTKGPTPQQPRDVADQETKTTELPATQQVAAGIEEPDAPAGTEETPAQAELSPDAAPTSSNPDDLPAGA